MGPDQLIEADESDLERSSEAGLLPGGEQIDDESGEHRFDQRRFGGRDVERHALAGQTLLDVRSPESDLLTPYPLGSPLSVASKAAASMPSRTTARFCGDAVIHRHHERSRSACDIRGWRSSQ